jgi:hypothetical protein
MFPRIFLTSPRKEVDEQANITEIAHFDREGFNVGSLGLHLEEAKALPGRLQFSMIDTQAAEAIARMSVCPECGSRLTVKGHHRLVYRSVFGRMLIDSPRLYQCRCSGARAGPSVRWPIACGSKRVPSCITARQICCVDVLRPDRPGIGGGDTA